MAQPGPQYSFRIGQIFLLHLHHGDLGKSFLKRWLLQLPRHAPHGVLRDLAFAALIAGKADFDRYVEEDRLDFIAVILGQFDPSAALVRRQIRGVDVIHGTLCDQPRLQHGTQVRENQILKALFRGVIKQERAQEIAGEWRNVVPFEPRTLAGTRQSDRQNDYAFGRTLRGRLNLGQGYGGCSRCRTMLGEDRRGRFGRRSVIAAPAAPPLPRRRRRFATSPFAGCRGCTA